MKYCFKGLNCLVTITTLVFILIKALDLFFNFIQDDAGLSGRGDLTKIKPMLLASYVTPNSSAAILDQIQTSSSFSKERVLSGSVDLKTDLILSDDLSAIIKFGGMYHYRDRTNTYNEYQGSHRYSGGGGVITAISQAYPDLIINGGLSLENFDHANYSYGDFLNGDYSLAFTYSRTYKYPGRL